MADPARANVLEDIMPQESRLDVWLGLGVLLVMLFAVALLARRRSRVEEEDAPSRLMRICFTAAGFSGATTLLLVIELLWRPDASVSLPLNAIYAAIVLLVVGMILFGIFDFWLGLWRPGRTRGWLMAAIPLFAAYGTLSIAVAFWLEGSSNDLMDVGMLQVVIVAVISAIIWWSYLPAPRVNLANRFD